jgi:hypothetical protein
MSAEGGEVGLSPGLAGFLLMSDIVLEIKAFTRRFDAFTLAADGKTEAACFSIQALAADWLNEWNAGHVLQAGRRNELASVRLCACGERLEEIP